MQDVLKVKVKVKVKVIADVIRALLCGHKNHFFSQANDWSATKIIHDGTKVNDLDRPGNDLGRPLYALCPCLSAPLNRRISVTVQDRPILSAAKM